MYWQCIEQKWGGLKFRKWVLWLGHPEDDDSEIYFEFEEKEYRKVIKALPKFKAGEIFTGRMTFVEANAPRRQKDETPT